MTDKAEIYSIVWLILSDSSGWKHMLEIGALTLTIDIYA